jgi:uncharacterized protein DUF2252
MTSARPGPGVVVLAALVAFTSLALEIRASETSQVAAQVPPQNQPLAPFGENASFTIEKSSLRAQGLSPELLARIEASPYRYFRLLGLQFAARTCFAFQDLRWRLPSVAVHGDAHLEQFVVTDTTYGMEDFDQSGFGPSVVDLVRFAASIRLACRQASWRCDADRAIDAYFSAYREAIDHPVKPTEPAMVDRMRNMSPLNHPAWLQWLDPQIRALPSEEETQYRNSWARFVELLTEAQPNRPASRLEIVRLGRIEIGVGSALQKKVLIRTRGASDDPGDDVVLEARLTTRPTGHECVWRPPHGGSLHVILFTSILGRRMPEIFGFLPQEQDRMAPEWWIQSWDSGYREMSITYLNTQTELDELAADAARQLAGHLWNTFPEPLRPYLRYGQLHAFDLVDVRARMLARDLSDEVVAAWERFRSGS